MTATLFENHRSHMLAIAYRMLGSMTDAEDMVQQAYLRYQAKTNTLIESPKAYFGTMITRLCLNHLQRAQQQREQYPGPWLPEPIVTCQAEADNPAVHLELQESLSLAFLTLLEQLTALERAVFLLREVFDYDYGDIALILGKEESACRQLLSRAKKHIIANRPRFQPSPAVHRHLLTQFLHTIESGDVDGLVNLLTEDVVLYADGGGRVRGALPRPLEGRTAVAKFVIASPRLVEGLAHSAIIEINGTPALVVRTAETTQVVITIEIEHPRIRAIHVVGNPEKLRRVNDAIQEEKGEQP